MIVFNCSSRYLLLIIITVCVRPWFQFPESQEISKHYSKGKLTPDPEVKGSGEPRKWKPGVEAWDYNPSPQEGELEGLLSSLRLIWAKEWDPVSTNKEQAKHNFSIP